MNTVLMAIAVVQDDEKILLRKMDSANSPYNELWALFGGRVKDNESIVDALNKEIVTRWNFSVSIVKKLWWDEETKVDHDGEEKRFIYLDTICSIKSGAPKPLSMKETLEWATIAELEKYDVNPPTRVLLQKLGYLN